MLKKLLKQIIAIALKADLVGLVLHAIEGTEIEANGASQKALLSGVLEIVIKCDRIRNGSSIQSLLPYRCSVHVMQ